MNVGTLAGGALGFIAGDLPGALDGARWGGEAYEFGHELFGLKRRYVHQGFSSKKKRRMPHHGHHHPTPTHTRFGGSRSRSHSRGRSYSRTPSYHGGRRSMSISTHGSHRSGTGTSYHGGYVNEATAGSTRVASTKKVIKKVIQASKKPKVHASRVFKEKVRVSLLGDLGTGLFISEVISSIYNMCRGDKSTAYTWTQNPYIGANSGSLAPTVVAGVDFNHFTPDRIMDAASVLYNGKTPGLNYKTPNGNFNSPATQAQYNGKIEVINSGVLYYLRNNGGIQRTLHFYELVPRTNITSDRGTPLEILVNCLAEDVTNGVSLSPFNVNPASSPWSAGSPTNTDLNYTTKGGVSPMLSPSVRNTFKINERVIVMEPGQSTEFYIQGPKNYIYDYSKLWQGTTPATNYIKYPKNISSLCFFVEIPQIMTDSYGNVSYQGYVDDPVNTTFIGTPANPVNTSFGGGVGIKQKFSYQIRCPEEATVDRRHNVYCVLDTATNGHIGQGLREDEENPAQPQVNPTQ